MPRWLGAGLLTLVGQLTIDGVGVLVYRESLYYHGGPKALAHLGLFIALGVFAARAPRRRLAVSAMCVAVALAFLGEVCFGVYTGEVDPSLFGPVVLTAALLVFLVTTIVGASVGMLGSDLVRRRQRAA